jgi:hypothetical protein
MVKLTRPECPYPKALEDCNYKHKTNKEALKTTCYDKCMYCESKIGHIDYAHIEHIKPKAVEKFPELEFIWDNLGYACPKCNGAKSDKYDDQCPFINPYDEDPSERLFASGSWVFVRNGCERAEITIRELELNRPELLEKRMERLNQIDNLLKSCYRTQSESVQQLILKDLEKECEVNKEYSLCVKAFLDAHRKLKQQTA